MHVLFLVLEAEAEVEGQVFVDDPVVLNEDVFVGDRDLVVVAVLGCSNGAAAGIAAVDIGLGKAVVGIVQAETVSVESELASS